MEQLLLRSSFTRTTAAIRTTAAWLFLALALCVTAAAQSVPFTTSVSAPIGVRVTVVGPQAAVTEDGEVEALEVVGVNSLRFGQIVATNRFRTSRIEKTSPDAGRFEIRGTGNRTVLVSYTAPDRLLRTSGRGSIGVQVELFGSEEEGNAASAQRLMQNSAVDLLDGNYFFILGGALNVGPLTANPPGRYVGVFELNVSYMNL